MTADDTRMQSQMAMHAGFQSIRARTKEAVWRAGHAPCAAVSRRLRAD